MSYKAKARAYFTAVSNYDVATVEAMLDENYIQHNPNVPTGRAAFLALIPRLKESGAKIQNLRLFEDGQHVIMHHRWKNAQVFGHSETVAFHIIRFDSQELIAEHWNVMMPSEVPMPTNIKFHKQHKLFREANLTLTISEGLCNGEVSAIYDLCDSADEKITQHWRIFQKIPTENLANENTMFGFEAGLLAGLDCRT